MAEKFDVIIIGGGPAGSTAGYMLAKERMSVLILERGEFPGAKNLFGGVLYTNVLNGIIPSFWEKAPIERYVSKYIISALSEGTSVSIEVESTEFSEAPYNGITVLRSKFDNWLASKAQEAGALLMVDTVVDDIIWEDGRAVGVKVRKDEGEVYANIIIAADGLNSVIRRKSHLEREYSPEEVAVGVKELIKLPEEEIEKRFGLTGREGKAYTFIGAATNGIEGGGFIYTNRNSLSVGVVCNLGGLLRRKTGPFEVIENFKRHPMVARLVDGGELKEYSGHLVNEGGLDSMPPLYSDGLLVAGDAATMCINNGLLLRGVDFAVGSGAVAAKTAKIAYERKDFSKRTLSRYKTGLEEGFVMKDMRTYRHASSFLRNRRLYTTYPAFLCDLSKELFSVEGVPKEKIWKTFREKKKGKLSLWDLAKDLKSGMRGL